MSEEKTYNKITVVDKNDKVIGAEMMNDAIDKGLLRSGVRIFVFSESGKVLLQKRSPQVRHPNLWSMSADGHVDEGEDRETAANRELAEETGVTGFALSCVEESFVAPGTINGVYKVVVPDDIELKHQEEEVSELKWVSIDELDSIVQYHPKECTRALSDTWSTLKNQLILA